VERNLANPRRGEFLHLGVIARLGFGRGDVAGRLQEAAVVEPIHPGEGGELDWTAHDVAGPRCGGGGGAPVCCRSAPPLQKAPAAAAGIASTAPGGTRTAVMSDPGGGAMDIVEVTLRLDRELAERLRRDPAERARYEVFLGLAAAAQTSAQVEQAARLFTAPPAERQRLLVEMLDGAFGSDLALALRGGAAAWSAAVCRALSTEAPQAAVDPPSVRDEGRAATVGRALGGRTLGEGERAAPARRSDASPHAPLVLPGVSALLLLMLGGGTMALWWSAIPQQGPAFAGAAVEGRAGRPPAYRSRWGPALSPPTTPPPVRRPIRHHARCHPPRTGGVGQVP
jgi:hypothetical protein